MKPDCDDTSKPEVAACSSAHTKPVVIDLKPRQSLGSDRVRHDTGSLEARKRFRMMVESYRPVYRVKSSESQAEVFVLHAVASECAKKLMDEVSRELAQDKDAYDFDSSPVKSLQQRHSRGMWNTLGSPFSSFSTATHPSFVTRSILSPRTSPDVYQTRLSCVSSHENFSPTLVSTDQTLPSWKSGAHWSMKTAPSFHLDPETPAPTIPSLSEHTIEEPALSSRGFVSHDVGTEASREASPSPGVLPTGAIDSAKLRLPQQTWLSSPNAEKGMNATTTTSKQSGLRSVLIGKIGGSTKDAESCTWYDNEDAATMRSPVKQSSAVVRVDAGTLTPASSDSIADRIDAEHAKIGWQARRGLTLPLLPMPTAANLDLTPSSFLTHTTELAKTLPTTQDFYRHRSQEDCATPAAVAHLQSEGCASPSGVSTLFGCAIFGSTMSCADYTAATEARLSAPCSSNVGPVSYRNAASPNNSS